MPAATSGWQVTVYSYFIPGKALELPSGEEEADSALGQEEILGRCAGQEVRWGKCRCEQGEEQGELRAKLAGGQSENLSNWDIMFGPECVIQAQFLLAEEEKEEFVDEEAQEQPKMKGLLSDFSIEKLFGFLAPKSKREGRVELVLDVTGFYRIDYKATKNLIDAGMENQLRVSSPYALQVRWSSFHSAHGYGSLLNISWKSSEYLFLRRSEQCKCEPLYTSDILGNTKFGWPAAVLNLFWGVLYCQGKPRLRRPWWRVASLSQ
ncbi:hypothetical protein R1flu_020895 [Riccia fluitans]|uniref:Uncharacterized protein n=1 Tax=Riccia fluitans TaxID=41844 RepID=A0ABD1ZNA4_9MARC